MSDESDPLAELEAMKSVVQALQPLNETARRRVITWCADKFLTPLSQPPLPVPPQVRTMAPATPPPQSVDGTDANIFGRQFADLAEFYHACNPASDVERALAGSAWIQHAEGVDGLDSFRINSELKQLGYGVGNITRALDALIISKPALVIQLRKTGTSRQARKTFRVTDAGYKKVREMIAQNAT